MYEREVIIGAMHNLLEVKITPYPFPEFSKFFIRHKRDPNKAEKFLDKKWNQLPSGFERDMYTESCNKATEVPNTSEKVVSDNTRSFFLK